MSSPPGEKHGWMGDALDASEQALYNFEMGPVHEAFMQVIEVYLPTYGRQNLILLYLISYI